jgi:galactokinase
MMDRVQRVKQTFIASFQNEPTHYFQSSGRAEILGNHTDHQGGAVLVAAIDLTMIAAVAPRGDGKIVLMSEGYPKIEVAIADLAVRPYEFSKTSGIMRGVSARLLQLGYQIGGFSIALNSTIRPGSGVSSSASIELMIAKVHSVLYNDDRLDAVTMAKIAQYAENTYFGKPSGLLDQMGIALGGINYIEFDNIEAPYHEAVPYPINDLRFLIINTGGSHTDLTEHYAAVKDDMRQIAAFYGKRRLIEISPTKFQADIVTLARSYGVRAVNRALHFFGECDNVKAAKYALLKGDRVEFLKYINKSGLSSEQLLENITYQGDVDKKLLKALNFARSIISKGAVRVHGGGFAGTILCIIPDDEYGSFIEAAEPYFGADNISEVRIIDQGIMELDVGNLNIA